MMGAFFGALLGSFLGFVVILILCMLQTNKDD